MRIDAYLPIFDVADFRETEVPGEPGHAFEIFRSLDLERSRFVRLLFAVRTIPSRFHRQTLRPSAASFVDRVQELGWRILEEDRGRELVMGAVTRPWAPVVRFHGLPGPEFVAFDEPGYTKIAWNIAARPTGRGTTVLSTETRVAATDAWSRRRFRRYWFVFGRGIRLIRWAALRLVRREIERSSRNAARRHVAPCTIRPPD